MAIEAVAYELPAGIHAMQNLMSMIAEALVSCKIAIYQKSPGWDWMGYYLDPKAKLKPFVGIYYDAPTQLTFEGFLDTKADNYEAICNQLAQHGAIRADGCWTRQQDLASEEVHFFALGKVSQMRCIEVFILEAWRIFRETNQPITK
jgi:hypothetical protein